MMRCLYFYDSWFPKILSVNTWSSHPWSRYGACVDGFAVSLLLFTHLTYRPLFHVKLAPPT